MRQEQYQYHHHNRSHNHTTTIIIKRQQHRRGPQPTYRRWSRLASSSIGSNNSQQEEFVATAVRPSPTSGRYGRFLGRPRTTMGALHRKHEASRPMAPGRLAIVAGEAAVSALFPSTFPMLCRRGDVQGNAVGDIGWICI